LSQAEKPDKVEVALAAVGTGTAAEMSRRLINERITVFGDEHRAQAVSALSELTHQRRIIQGRLFRRVDAIFQQVLELHERSGKLELFLFQDEIPSATLYRGCVLAISDGLGDPLYDGELAGIIAHELSHSYFEDEMEAARRASDPRAMRVTELKCDGVALVSLKLMGHDPAVYLRGLQRIQAITKRKGRSSSVLQTHPELAQRAQFAQRLIKLLEQ
jgi:Zn-dependent protease with chaperone function